MIIREYTTLDKKQVIELVSNILGGIFNGEPTKFEYIKEFNVTKYYLIYLLAETEGKEKTDESNDEESSNDEDAEYNFEE